MALALYIRIYSQFVVFRLIVYIKSIDNYFDLKREPMSRIKNVVDGVKWRLLKIGWQLETLATLQQPVYYSNG